MENQAFVIEQLYPAPTYKLWNAITDKDQMKRAMRDTLTQTHDYRWRVPCRPDRQASGN